MDPTNRNYTVTPKSEIQRSTFWSRLSAAFGFRKPDKKGEDPLMVKVDTGNTERFDLQHSMNVVTGKLSSRLNELFDNWLNDTAEFGFNNAKQIHKIYDDLLFAATNDPFLFRRVNLVADEATNPDTLTGQIVSVETPDKRASIRIYQLLKQWNITQDLIRSTIWNIDLLGNAYWSIKLTQNGVERVKLFSTKLVKERLEFNPIEVSEQLAAKNGDLFRLSTKSLSVQKMLDEIDSKETNEYIDMLDTRHFGYVINNDLVLPPWALVHFRLNAAQSDFSPYGMPELIFALAPFRQAQATMTLQSIARLLSLPVTLYKIKTHEGMDEAAQFEAVERARTAYENIGVTPVGNGETYSNNTKMWIPEGLLEMDVKSIDANIDFIKDLELYQDRVAIASGIPKGYLVQEWGGGWGQSAISLVEQFKPFARLIYARQSAFLDGLAELIRLHFSITGEFDYTMPFTLSMRFPAEEMSDDKRDARTASLDLANDIMDTVRLAVGAGEDEELPPEIVQDIIAKYTFLNDVDITKWTTLMHSDKISKAGSKKDDGDSSSSKKGKKSSKSSSSDFDLDLGDEDLTDEDTTDEDTTDEDIDLDLGDLAGEDTDTSEDITANESVLRAKRKKLLREAKLREKYFSKKQDIYFTVLREHNIEDFNRDKQHVKAFHTITEESNNACRAAKLDLKITEDEETRRLRERTLSDVVNEYKTQKQNGEF